MLTKVIKINKKKDRTAVVSLNEMYPPVFSSVNTTTVQSVTPRRPKKRGTKKKCDYCSRIFLPEKSFDKFMTNDKIIQIARTMYPGKTFGHIDCIIEPIKTPKTMGWQWSVEETSGVKVSYKCSPNKKYLC